MPASLSLLVPTYNKCSYLELMLTSLTTQSDTNYELVVVDDGSTDATPAVVSRFASVLPQLRYVRQQNGGRSKSRNRAIEVATGDLLIFTEDDYILRSDFIESHRRAHRESGDTVVVGGIGCQVITHDAPHSAIPVAHLAKAQASQRYNERVQKLGVGQGSWGRLVDPDDILERLRWIETLALCGSRAEQIEWVEKTFSAQFNGFYVPWLFFGGGNISFPRAACLEFGGFNEQFSGWGSEDLELGYRLFKQGLTFHLDTKTRNLHQIHARSGALIHEQAQRNHTAFCTMHPSFELYAFYLHDSLRYAGILQQPLSLREYNQLVAEFYSSTTLGKRQKWAALQRQLSRHGIEMPEQPHLD